MAASTAKASRCDNFSEPEKLFLAELLKEYPVIEDKGYDSGTIARKKRAWIEILHKFHAEFSSTPKRALEQLKGCWRRIKIKTKKEHDGHRQAIRKTGGGEKPPSPSQLSKLAADVIDASLEPLENPFDDDGIAEAQQQISRREDGNKRWRHRAEPMMGRTGRELFETTETDAAFESDISDALMTQHTEVCNVSGSKRKKARGGEDPFLKLALTEHKAKMKILKLKELKLKQECKNLGIRIPTDLINDTDQ